MQKALALLLTLLLPANALAASLQDGIYRDQADGYGGKVIVTVIVMPPSSAKAIQWSKAVMYRAK